MYGKKLFKILTFNTVERRNCCLTACLNKAFNKPPSANELPRPAGISSMFRLPVVSSTEGPLGHVSISRLDGTMIVQFLTLTLETEPGKL